MGQAGLGILDSYDVLDSASEAEFGAITRLAALTLDTPIALVSLVDQDRQWFMSRYGIDVPQATTVLPFCAQAVQRHTPLIVPNATLDPRFVDDPFVTGEAHVRFYAGVPLEAADGRILGTLCAVDRRPRELTPGQKETLLLLARQTMALLELRRVGRELRDERARLAGRERELTTLLDSMVEGVAVHDRSGAIVLHNRSAEAILGLRADQLDGSTSFDAAWRALRADGSPFPGDEHPAMLAITRGESSRDVVMGIEYAGSGERRWIEINARPLLDATDARPYAALSTFRDITEQRTIRERLAQHDRLVTTGTLAAGVGHEINNPLAYVLTNLSLAIEELEVIGRGSLAGQMREVIELLEQAREGGERVKRIVRGLKALARVEGEVVPLDPHGSIRSAVELAGHDLRSRATVVLELEPVPPVIADDGRLTQVIVNLVVNATQAFRTGVVAENRVTIRSSAKEGRVVIEVSDNGPGIPAEVLPRIFDPFFTTKAPNVGAGLGLSISHGIITSMGGQLDCETEVGRGTTFRISIPAADNGPLEAEGPKVALRGRVMAVDDEPTILKSLSRMLGRDVQTVVTFDDPREALAAIQAGERFDVVFCDILMPNMTGIDLYDEVQRISPEQADRFVFVTGDMTRPEIQQFLARVGNERLEKPFSIQNVRGIARRFIASRSTRG